MNKDEPQKLTEEQKVELVSAADVDRTVTIQDIANPKSDSSLDTKDQLAALAENERRKPDQLINSTVGQHYQILECIGVGGMGKVYKAKHVLLNKLVAIKFLQESKLGLDETTIRRFHQEAQMVVKLQHPNIPALREFGIESNTPYIVMDYVEARPLSSLIQDRSLSPQEICALIAQICSALDHAHKSNIVHRDIKPSNILIQKDPLKQKPPKAFLLDFGIAKTLDAITDSRLTETGELVGTVKYMSPEQFKGFPASSSSDLYSIGCVLFEALSGKPPFSSTNRLEIILKHQQAEAPNLPDTVPTNIQNIVYRCLEKTPERRYQSAAELALDLDRASHGQASTFLVPRVKSRHKALLTSMVTIPSLALLSWLLFISPNQNDLGDLSKRIAENPESPASLNLYLKRGNLYFKNKNFNQALYDYTHAAKISPNAFALHRAATCFYETGDYDNALTYAEKAQKASPHDAEAIAIGAAAKAKLGRTDESSADYTQLLSQIPNTISSLRLAALNNRANNYYVQGKYDLALADLDQVLKLQENNEAAQLSRASIEFSKGEYEKALKDVRSVLKQNPKSDRGHELRGRINFQWKRYESALDDFTDAINLGMKDLPIYMDRARCYLALGQFEPALKDCDNAAKISPENLTAKYYRVFILLKENKLTQANSQLASLLSQYPHDADLALLKAAKLVKEGDQKEALKIRSSIETAQQNKESPLKVNEDFLSYLQELQR